MTDTPDHYVAIDEEGLPLSKGSRVADPVIAAQILRTLRFADNGAFICDWASSFAYVEAFDEPLVVQRIEAPVRGVLWTAHLPFDLDFSFSLESLTLDEWDRFHGLNENKIPFVMSRSAQEQFFESLDAFDDDSIEFGGKQIQVGPWMTSNPEIRNEKYWSQIYQSETPGWEMQAPAVALVDMLPRMKMPKSRILVLGCGSGNDAAHFAEQGHLVTAVDFSPEAVTRGREKYDSLSANLKFVQEDIFRLGPDWNEKFDLVFEHTCYCAIPPEKRNDLVQIWRRVLVPTGQLMGIFFTNERRSSPPFGGTEWELRERLKKTFQFQFWGRWPNSVGRRQGKELFVLGTKR